MAVDLAQFKSVGPVLITGDGGFVGGRVRTLLSAAGCEIQSLRQAVGIQSSPASGYILSEQIASAGLQVAAIVHCAGNSSIRASFDDPRMDFKANLCQVMELLEYVRLHSPHTRLVLFSTSAVYGDATAPSSEQDRRQSISPYGQHKAMMEDLVAFYGRVYGVRTSIIRPLSVYGPGQRKQIIWDALSRFASGNFHFLGGGDNVRDFIHVDDVASLVAPAIDAAHAGVPVFNAGTGQGVTIRVAMNLLAELSGYAGRVTFGGACWPGDPRVLVGVNDAARALGWEPRIGLYAGLRATVQWFNEIRSAQ